MQGDHSAARREEVRTFWTGPPLSLYEVLSLKSLLATGAKVVLYSYERDLTVPDGVELRDANEILSEEVLRQYNADSDKGWSRHSDLFRYIMLHRFGGWYVDLDVICLRDHLPSAEMYVARADADTIYNGIMKFPAGFPALTDLIAQAQTILPAADKALTEKARLVIGPRLLSRVLREHGLDDRAQPRSKAYEIPFQDALAFFNPAQCGQIEARLADSDFTHLWNGAWTTLRIPKTYGPPQGSWLDMMFRRFDIRVSEHGRLSYDALMSWVMEDCLLEEYRAQAGGGSIGKDKVAAFAAEIERIGWQPRERLYRPPPAKAEAAPADAPPLLAQTSAPQTVRSFWHGARLGPYQLLCLKSFADRGHRVEVFSYDANFTAPDWLTVRDARDILTEEEVLSPLPQGGEAIHGDLFRYALLERLGGWWTDPDVLLMQPELPDADLFVAGHDAFGQIPPAVLKCPAAYPLMKAALTHARALGGDHTRWPRAGAPLWTTLAAGHEAGGLRLASEPLGPVSWFTVPDLFDPAKADRLSRQAAAARFLRLQDEVWRRAGIPAWLAPPEGSFLGVLLQRHGIDTGFPASMEFPELNRWIRHMYRAVQAERADPSAALGGRLS
ncbi:MAG: hypothetical protein J0G95_00055 [Rhizobiales bacterium]|nr:hypothetical protein [Hyphomicrobiales bacterium]